MGTRRRAAIAGGVLLLLLTGVAGRLALTPPAGTVEPEPAERDAAGRAGPLGEVGDSEPDSDAAPDSQTGRAPAAPSRRRRVRVRPRKDEAQEKAQLEALEGLGYLQKQRDHLKAWEAEALKEFQSAVEVRLDSLVYGRMPNGAEYLKGRILNGKRDGLWTEQHPKGGRTESEYLDGVRHGAEAAWHADGRLKFLGQYQDGEMSGTWTSWHAGGAVMAARSYVSGKLHGWVRTFHANGRLKEESYYDVGKETGLNRGWHENGQLAWEIPYEDGSRSGAATWYDEQGYLASEGTYVYGKLDGIWTSYEPDGSVKTVEKWVNGQQH